MASDMHARRIARFQERLASLPGGEETGAWILQPENRRFLSGFTAEDGHLTESCGSLLLSPSRGILVTDGRYTLQAEEEVAPLPVHTLDPGFVEALCRLVKDMGLTRLGFEPEYLVWGRLRDVEKALADTGSSVSLFPLDPWVEEMREIKDAEEREALTRAAEMISRILDALLPRLSPGMRERDVADRILQLAREAGAEGLSFPAIVASGPNSALPHAVPTDRRIQAGEPIVIDVGVRVEGYCSDITRTVFLGEPSPEFKVIYRTVREAQVAALAAIHPGMMSDALYRVARDRIADAGYGDCFRHGLGHGVGLAVHENPRLGALKPVPLREGMTFTVEPGIYVAGKGGVRLEEMVLLESEGPRVLTTNGAFYDF